jgi:hypothetical protein
MKNKPDKPGTVLYFLTLCVEMETGQKQENY